MTGAYPYSVHAFRHTGRSYPRAPQLPARPLSVFTPRRQATFSNSGRIWNRSNEPDILVLVWCASKWHWRSLTCRSDLLVFYCFCPAACAPRSSPRFPRRLRSHHRHGRRILSSLRKWIIHCAWTSSTSGSHDQWIVRMAGSILTSRATGSGHPAMANSPSFKVG